MNEYSVTNPEGKVTLVQAATPVRALNVAAGHTCMWQYLSDSRFLSLSTGEKFTCYKTTGINS
jgi:hypothetical protein